MPHSDDKEDKRARSMKRARTVKKVRQRKEARYGLKDMFVDRPNGDAGLIMAMVWGNSEAEFAEIVARELDDRQRRNPDTFTKKIKPRTGRKWTRDR